MAATLISETGIVTGGAPSGDSEIVSETGTIGVLVRWPSYAFGYRRLDVVSETGPGP